MTLADEDRIRVEAAVRRMIAEYRAKPTQEKEDGLGVEIAALPPAEREHVTAVLLRIVAEERGRDHPPRPGKRAGRP
jgi:hypothetical protein